MRGNFTSLKSFGSKTETGFKKTNASSNDLNHFNNRLLNGRPTTTGTGGRTKTQDKFRSSMGVKKGTYESNFTGAPGIPGNPLPQELGKSNSVKPGMTRIQRRMAP